MRFAFALAILGAGCGPANPPPLPASPSPRAAATSEIETISPPIRGFYARRLRDGGIPILGHATVSDEGMFAARERLRLVLASAPSLRRNLEAAGLELHVVALKQFTSDLPEHLGHRGETLENGELFDWHMIGGHITGRFSSCTEATLIGVVGHRLFANDPCVHELAHAVDMHGLDSATRARVNAAYERSIAAGHWKGAYAAKNHAEWFAEMTRFYFAKDGAAPAFYDPGAGHGRAWLAAEDPDAFALVDALYSGRLDPGTPRVIALVLGPGADESKLKSATSREPADLAVENDTTAPIRLVWIDFDGRRDRRQSFAKSPRALPGDTIRESSWVGHTFVVTDDEGRALCTFAVGHGDSIAKITGDCR